MKAQYEPSTSGNASVDGLVYISYFPFTIVIQKNTMYLLGAMRPLKSRVGAVVEPDNSPAHLGYLEHKAFKPARSLTARCRISPIELESEAAVHEESRWNLNRLGNKRGWPLSDDSTGNERKLHILRGHSQIDERS
jgi:hypothetical protein